MKKIGLTGGIGSGKTYVSNIFSSLGIPIFYWDDKAKELMINSESLKESIILSHCKEIYYCNSNIPLFSILLENKKDLVIGSGGVSPAVIFSLQKSKIKNIAVINRTHDKSIFLKKKFNFLNILEWKFLKQEISKFDIIVNATSLGLKSGNDFEFNFDNVKDNLIYIDTIYNPIETKTLKFLKENKVKTFNGLDMFIYQGQKSFYLWNKINPEIDEKLVDLLISKLKWLK